MSLNTSNVQPEPHSVNRPDACAHGRMISDSVTEEEHKLGKIRCVECGSIVLDPHLKQEGKEV